MDKDCKSGIDRFSNIDDKGVTNKQKARGHGCTHYTNTNPIVMGEWVFVMLTKDNVQSKGYYCLIIDYLA